MKVHKQTRELSRKASRWKKSNTQQENHRFSPCTMLIIILLQIILNCRVNAAGGGVSCSPGRYSQNGQETCTDCSPGKYQQHAQQTLCYACPSGYSSSEVGADGSNEGGPNGGKKGGWNGLDRVVRQWRSGGGIRAGTFQWYAPHRAAPSHAAVG